MASRGRGGRGERLRELLQLQEEEERRKMLHPVSEPHPQPETEAVMPLRLLGRGRGRLLAEHLASSSSQEPPLTPYMRAEGPVSPPTSLQGDRPTPPMGRGRRLLSMLQESGTQDTTSPCKPDPRGGGDAGTHAMQVAEVTHRMERAFISGQPEGHIQPRAKPMPPQETPPEIHKGESGKPVCMTANYIRLECDPEKGMFEYFVRFMPEVDNVRLKYDLLSQQKAVIGEVRNFDGATLYLPHQLPNSVTRVCSKSKFDNSVVTLNIEYQRKRTFGECIHFYNTLFKRIMNMLNFVRFGRNHFNPADAMMIPQHRLEVWPGYVMAIDEYEDGIMLCCDVSSRVLRRVTAYQIIQEILMTKPQDYQAETMAALVGKTVMTDYNKDLYRIDDVNFEKTPEDTFSKNGQDISYIEYYKTRYNVNITDRKQPLLIHRDKKKNVHGESEDVLISIIPELSYMTGLTDEMRSDFKVMKDIGAVTRLTPNQRQFALKKFINSVTSNPDISNLLKKWGLRLAPNTVELMGRHLEREMIKFGNNYTFEGSWEADWGRESTNHNMLSVVDLNNWLIILTRRDTRCGNDFVEMMKKVGPQMGMRVGHPQFEVIGDDRIPSYMTALKKSVCGVVQIVVAIFPTQRDDRYAAFKKFCCLEQPISSQAINSKTICNQKKLRSVTQKIALQMNCKLGGTLWSLNIPFKGTMICGVDSYHDASKRSNSWVGFVSSMNESITRWYSQTVQQLPGQELVDSLKIALANSLKQFHAVNGNYPETIFMFRDGVGDGQLKTCEKHEIPQLISSFKCVATTYSPKFCFVVVQKRINTRLFINGPELNNPMPGSIMDNSVTRRNYFDFFIVSQHVRQGTVTPTHYVVLHNSTKWSPDRIQRVTYKMCHLYYNWPGTIRVPAPCQYAHKLAYLVGQSVRKTPDAKLNDKLYFL